MGDGRRARLKARVTIGRRRAHGPRRAIRASCPAPLKLTRATRPGSRLALTQELRRDPTHMLELEADRLRIFQVLRAEDAGSGDAACGAMAHAPR